MGLHGARCTCELELCLSCPPWDASFCALQICGAEGVQRMSSLSCPQVENPPLAKPLQLAWLFQSFNLHGMITAPSFASA